ncbi:MAG TPA: arginine--tRNA ligase [Candidatus Nanoarchaeia archaeon]|nr:arginine--tRNA ligase [Candidatus Nanoarchaeia archaeon]
MKERVISLLLKPTKLKKNQLENLVQIPKDAKLGDFTFPCFLLAKTLKKNPDEIAKDIADRLKNNLEFENVEPVGGYVNIFVNRHVLAEETLKKIQKERSKYGSNNLGKKKKILIEMSSPNIAKPFGIGHLRSTIIGNSIAKIAEFSGFKTIKLNYLGDWGTQFGKLILGYKKFGNPDLLKLDPIEHLLEIYVKVNANPDLESEAREWFKRLELGDKEAFALWKKFRELSLKDFDEIYKRLNIKFDITSGESDYNKQMEMIVKELQKKNLLVKSEGAQIVDLRKFNLGVVLIKKSDGTTIYATRDIAAAIDRYKKYKFDAMFYEVGSEQKLHFEQIFKTLELMGYKWAKTCLHINHGLYLGKDGKKFATRKGKTVFVGDIVAEAKDLAEKEILKRDSKTAKKELANRAEAIALAAIIYGDLKNYRANDVVYDIERFTSFEGDTGPYLLYSYARAKSILAKAKFNPKKKYSIHDMNDSEKNLVSKLEKFEEAVINSYNNFSPNTIANYTFETSQQFNEFYHSNQVIGSENEQFRLVLVDSFAKVLNNALSLLGIKTLEKM